MSYILDALRRADAERQRGAVPGLHAQPGPAGLAHAGPDRLTASRRRWWLGGLLAAAALVLAGGASLRWTRVAPSGPSLAAPVDSTPAAAALPPVAAAPAQNAPPPVAQPALQPAPRPLPQAAPQRAEPAPAVRPTARSALPVIPLAPVVAAPPAAARAASGAAATSLRLPTLAELPEATRRELPALAVGGAMYADQASARIVILNGQVVHEGDRLAPDLLVQQIRLKSVVLNFKGQPFEIGF